MPRCLKSAFQALSFAILGVIPLQADQISVSSFKGLNSNTNALVIDNNEASDALNVDVTPGGKSVKKAAGYGQYKSLTTGRGVHGGWHFFDSTGNDIQLWGSSTSLKSITADGTPLTLISSATLDSTWDCVDTQGNAYCVDSSRDAYIKTNGATMSWYTSPLGTMIEATPDRVVVAGVAASPSTLFVSGSNSFLNYTVGPLTTDPFNEPIAAPGSKLTHLRWACQKLLWWKDASFGYFDFDDQYSASVKTVSDTIGTFDNTSAIDPGGSIWFRGQDGHIWQYDCSGLIKQSVEITPFIQASGKRTANLWTQTTQSDFASGGIVPTNSLSTSANPGNVVTSSQSYTENSSTQWSLGTANNLSVYASSIQLTLNNSGTLTNPSFESAFTTNWSTAGVTALFGQKPSYTQLCTITPQSGSQFLVSPNGSSAYTLVFQVIDLNSTVLSTLSIPLVTDCVWRALTHTDNASKGKRVKFRFSGSDGSNAATLTTSDSYIFGGSVSMYYTGAGNNYFAIDNISNGSSTITSGSFTSQSYDTGFASTTYNITSEGGVNNTPVPLFDLQTASNSSTGPWTELVNAVGVNGIGNRYARYTSTISINGTDNALSAFLNITFVEKSTGSYYSAVKNAPNLTSWGTFNPTYQNNSGTHAFYIRASTGIFTVLSSTPVWAPQTANALVIYTTGTYFQIRDDLALTTVFDDPTLNDFTVNWYEGNAVDQAYMTYFDNAIWTSVAYGVGVSSNTYIFKRDLINDLWTPYGFGTGGFLVQNNHLFLGDTSTGGNVFQYGSGTSYNGSAINAYWKSKTFVGTDPFLENNYTQLDTYVKRDQNQTLTASYYLNGSTTTTSYSIVESSSTNAIIVNKKLLPTGKNGTSIAVQYGDNTDSGAWELFGLRVMYNPYPYRPTQ